jgi:hypothetical protein
MPLNKPGLRFNLSHIEVKKSQFKKVSANNFGSILIVDQSMIKVW